MLAATTALGPALLMAYLANTDRLLESGYAGLIFLLVSPVGAAVFVGLVVSTVRTRHRDLRLGAATIAALTTWFAVILGFFWILGLLYGWDD